MASHRSRTVGSLDGLRRALDEVEFGRDRILNLREARPSPAQAEHRAEAWLRERQVAHAGDVLIITGRGNQSYDGVSVVRETVARLLIRLRRKGVIAYFAEHTPGSFVARTAPITAMRDAAKRKAQRNCIEPADPSALAGLSEETRVALRALSERALEMVGVHDVEPFLEQEMLKQFSLLAAGVPDGPKKEERLRSVIERTIREYEDG